MGETVLFPFVAHTLDSADDYNGVKRLPYCLGTVWVTTEF